MQLLEYIMWGISITNTSPHPSFLYNHVDMGSFCGKDFTVDMAMVYTIIIKLCDGNTTLNTNAKILMRSKMV